MSQLWFQSSGDEHFRTYPESGDDLVVHNCPPVLAESFPMLTGRHPASLLPWGLLQAPPKCAVSSLQAVHCTPLSSSRLHRCHGKYMFGPGGASEDRPQNDRFRIRTKTRFALSGSRRNLSTPRSPGSHKTGCPVSFRLSRRNARFLPPSKPFVSRCPRSFCTSRR